MTDTVSGPSIASGTYEVDAKLQIPVGYKLAEGLQPRQVRCREYYLEGNGGADVWPYASSSNSLCIILEKLPEPPRPTIDTTTEEYRVEVYRQWLRGKTVEVRFRGSWNDAETLSWSWGPAIYRVKPENIIYDPGGKLHGLPCYYDGVKWCPVPE